MQSAKHSSNATELDISMETLLSICSDVMSELGLGHSERVYHRGVISVFNSKRIFHRSEVTTPIYFRGDVIGVGRADIVVGNFALEFKAVASTPVRASGQLMKYVKSLNDNKIKHFETQMVVSPFFGSDRIDSDHILESDYEDTKKTMQSGLFRGVLINFNQRTGMVEVSWYLHSIYSGLSLYVLISICIASHIKDDS